MNIIEEKIETLNETRNNAKIAYHNDLYTFISLLLIMKYMAVNSILFFKHVLCIEYTPF